MATSRITTGSTVSRDGTRIGFRRQGNGPGIVLVQGAMQTAHQYRGLARSLATTFTVYSPDRRGRGSSPRPYDSAHEVARDVEDVEAVLTVAGATRVFGLSSGAVVTLEAARTSDLVEMAAVFEPPFYADGISRVGIRRLHEQIDRGDLGAALISALEVAGTAPEPVTRLPDPVARFLGRVVLAVDAGSRALTRTRSASLRDLVPGVRYDFDVVAGVDRDMARYAAVRKPVLLLSGTRSPAFLRESVRALRGVLPRAEHVELSGLGHDGPWGAHPDAVAEELRRFFC